MCAIVGSFETDKLKELVTLNSYRGQHSHSFSLYNVTEHTMTCSKGFGEVDLNEIKIPKGYYGICHIQAPTTESKDVASIHPALFVDEGDKVSALWHNGIIKANAIKELQKDLHQSVEWDTYLLLLKVIRDKIPDNIDGTFSCLWYRPYEYGKGNLVLFRNEISPMFYDENLNISSTKFDGSYTTKPNVMIVMDLESCTLKYTDTFKTVECPYYFGE